MCSCWELYCVITIGEVCMCGCQYCIITSSVDEVNIRPIGSLQVCIVYCVYIEYCAVTEQLSVQGGKGTALHSGSVLGSRFRY